MPSTFFSVRGLNSAADVVEYSKSKPMFREVNMVKFLAATTTRRQFYHVSADDVLSPANARLFENRIVSTLEGMI